jgi:CDP-glucose 4,6-dehydratase
MKTFVITGATGFIGGALANRLMKDGNDVIALCRDGDPPDGCEVVRGDIEDLRTCERAINEYRPDGVFHLAAQAIVGHAKRDPFSTMETNIRGTYNLLEAFRRHRKDGSKMVLASSDKAYGELPEGAKAYDEDMPLEGRGPYDASKSCTDLIAQSYGLTYSLPIAVIRAGNVYGAGDWDLTRVVPSLVNDLVNGRPLTISSDGSPIRDYVHVDDIAKGYEMAYQQHRIDGPRAYNLSGRNPMSVLEMAEFIIDVAKTLARSPGHYVEGSRHYHSMDQYFKSMEARGEKTIKVLGTRMGEIQKQVLNPKRAKKELGWEATCDMWWGIRTTINWAYEHLDKR